MRSFKIVSDSASDVTEIRHTTFAYAPMKVITDEREFTDDGAVNVSEMVRYLAHYKGKIRSSCPNVDDWLRAFGGAKEIICVTITGAMSGSYNSACTAKRLYEEEYPGRRVYVVDSLSAGPEIRLMIEKLDAYAGAEISFEEACRRIEAYKARTGLLFMLKSLNNFANNGRVSPALAKIVSLAGICIVGKASEAGTLEPVKKVRGESKAMEALADRLCEEGHVSGRVVITHCENAAAALWLKDAIRQRSPETLVDIHTCRALCSFYAEQGGLLVGFERE